MSELCIEVRIGNAEIRLEGAQAGVIEIFSKICEGKLDFMVKNIECLKSNSGERQTSETMNVEVIPPVEQEKKNKYKRERHPVTPKELSMDEFQFNEDSFSGDVEKLGKATMPMAVYAVKFLEDNGFNGPITTDHVYTMYRRHGKVAGHDFRQGLSNAKFSGYVRGDLSDVKVTKTGIDYIEKKIAGIQE